MNSVREHILAALQVESNGQATRATLRIDPRFPLLADHFRGNPVMPGICLVQAVLLAVARREGIADLRVTNLKDCKFFSMAVPGDEVAITAQAAAQEDGSIAISARLSIGERRVAFISMLAKPVEGEEGGSA
jgi:3-hydroxymyristoyl/3-hydroxydecanoyl-(acyl carrier protein) dehydratase